MNQTPPRYILDISRLLSRAGQIVPTGIDRVELAYAEYLLQEHGSETQFAALSLFGKISRLPRDLVKSFILNLSSGWKEGNKKATCEARKIALSLKFHAILNRAFPKCNHNSFYLLLSHHHLMKKTEIHHFIKKTQTLFIPMVHDLIPIEYPEYARPKEPARHKARMHTVITLADGVIVPTHDVERALMTLLHDNKRNIPIWTIPHGVHTNLIERLLKAPAQESISKPYFVYLSTIEPRKNHLLLLHLWRDMVQKKGKGSVPYLFLVGKRGWENENILDLLERCPSLKDVVIEKSDLSDEGVASLLRGANGLLFSSFTEGYGLPLAEAMSLAVPSICADIPALREVAGDVSHYCPPLDTISWENAINDFTNKGPIWQHQVHKLKKHKGLKWEESISILIEKLESL